MDRDTNARFRRGREDGDYSNLFRFSSSLGTPSVSGSRESRATFCAQWSGTPSSAPVAHLRSLIAGSEAQQVSTLLVRVGHAKHRAKFSGTWSLQLAAHLGTVVGQSDGKSGTQLDRNPRHTESSEHWQPALRMSIEMTLQGSRLRWIRGCHQCASRPILHVRANGIADLCQSRRDFRPMFGL